MVCSLRVSFGGLGRIGAVLVGLLGCGAPTVAPLARTEPTEVTMPPDEPPTSVWVLPDAELDTALYGEWLDETADGDALYVLGSIRYVMARDGRVEVAPSAFTSNVRAAARLSDGWLFYLWDQSCWRTDTPLGEPRWVGHLPRGTFVEVARGQRGALTYSLDGDAFITDGGWPPRRIETLPRGAVTALASVDERTLFAHTLGGSTWRSEDRGQTFEPVGPRTAVTSMSVVGGVTKVRSPSGDRWLERTGEETEPPDRRPPSRTIAWLQALARAYPELLSVSGVPAPGGGRLLASLDDEDVLHVHEDGRWERVEGALPTSGCALSPWGDAALATCVHDDGLELLRSSVGARFAAFAVLPLDDETRVEVDAEGSYLWFEGRCEADRREWEGICLVNREGERREVRTGATVLAIAGGELVLETDEGLEVVALTERGLGETRLRFSYEEWPMAEIGVSRGLLTVVSGERRVRAWNSERGMLRLPEGTDLVAFADSRRGVAVGETLAEVHTTNDSGRTWQRLSIEEPYGRIGVRELRCAPGQCVVRGSSLAVVVRDFTPGPTTLHSSIALPDPPANAFRTGARVIQLDSIDHAPCRPLPLRCETSGAEDTPPRSLSWAEAGEPLGWTVRARGHARTHRAAPGRALDAGDVRLVWARGRSAVMATRDEGGSFRLWQVAASSPAEPIGAAGIVGFEVFDAGSGPMLQVDDNQGLAWAPIDRRGRVGPLSQLLTRGACFRQGTFSEGGTSAPYTDSMQDRFGLLFDADHPERMPCSVSVPPDEYYLPEVCTTPSDGSPTLRERRTAYGDLEDPSAVATLEMRSERQCLRSVELVASLRASPGQTARGQLRATESGTLDGTLRHPGGGVRLRCRVSDRDP